MKHTLTAIEKVALFDELVAALQNLLIAEKLDDDDPVLIGARTEAERLLAKVTK